VRFATHHKIDHHQKLKSRDIPDFRQCVCPMTGTGAQRDMTVPLEELEKILIKINRNKFDD